MCQTPSFTFVGSVFGVQFAENARFIEKSGIVQIVSPSDYEKQVWFINKKQNGNEWRWQM